VNDDHLKAEKIKQYPRRISFGYGVTSPEMEAQMLEALAEGFVECNRIQIRQNPDQFPCCLSCGRYRYVEPVHCRTYHWKTGRAVDPNCQHVYGAFPLDERGKGTCIDLACMLAAIYREKDGELDTRVIIEHELDADGYGIPGRYHAMVLREDGTIEDIAEFIKQKQKQNPEYEAQGMAVGSPPACDCGGA
jgi:hypothetical protein